MILRGVWHECVLPGCGGKLRRERVRRISDTTRIVDLRCKVCGERYKLMEEKWRRSHHAILNRAGA